MARVIDGNLSNHLRTSMYPWDEWFDGSLRQMTRGEDFTCEAASFIHNARVAAKARRLRVRARVITSDTIVLQAMPRADAAG